MAVVEMWPVWGGRGCNMTNCFRKYNMLIVLSSCLLYPIIITKSLNYVLNQNVTKKKCDKSINLYLLQQHKWNTIIVQPCHD